MLNLDGQAFSLAYHLFILFAVEAAFFIAWGHWRRNLSLVARRFAIGFFILGIVRVAFPAITVVTESAIASHAANHALVVISLGLIAWSFSPHLKQAQSLGVALLILNTLAAFILMGLHIALGEQLGDFLSYLWLVWQIGLGIVTIISLLQDYNQTHLFVIISFLLFVGGSGIQLLSEPLQDHFFIRLTEMIAYPILAMAVYREVIASLETHSEELKDLTQSSLEQIQGLISLFEATKNITSALDLSQVLDGAAKGVAQAVGVDQSAIALPEEGEANQLRMVATYNPHRAGRGESVTFPVSEHPAIKHALDRMREVEINTGYDAPQLKFLFAMMGANDETGPLIIQPLVLRNSAIGILIAGNAYSKQPFGPTKTQLIKTMANQIAIAIDNARSYQILATKGQQLAWTLRNQEQDASRRRAAMEAELKKSREEVSIISQRLYQQETFARKSEKELTDYQMEVNKLNNQLKIAQKRFEKLSQDNRRLSGLTASHQKQLDTLQTAEEELELLRSRVSELEIKESEAQKLNMDLKAMQERSRNLARALRLNQAKMQQMAGMPAKLTSAQATNELENLSCGVLISDNTGVINRVNNATTQLFNRPSEALVGKKLSEVSADEGLLQAVQKVEHSEDGFVSTTFTIDDKFIKATISPMVDTSSKEISGNVVILYDITEEFESQQARDEFVASLSQDLRTPMTSITGYVDLLLGESVGMIGDMQKKFLQRVQANVERMDLMLRDLIGVTAIDAGQLEIKPVPLDLAEVIEDAIIGAKAQLEEKEIQPVWEVPEQLPPVEADPDCIFQVMSNLLGNAAKVTPVGGDISVRAIVTNVDGLLPDKEEERWLQISVTDSGGGIAERDIDRVFDRFYKAERPLIQGLGETGVGLSIVKYLIEAHGGKVWLDTEMGRGSTFSFHLPIQDYIDDPWQEIDVPPLDLNSD